MAVLTEADWQAAQGERCSECGEETFRLVPLDSKRKGCLLCLQKKWLVYTKTEASLRLLASNPKLARRVRAYLRRKMPVSS